MYIKKKTKKNLKVCILPTYHRISLSLNIQEDLYPVSSEHMTSYANIFSQKDQVISRSIVFVAIVNSFDKFYFILVGW